MSASERGAFIIFRPSVQKMKNRIDMTAKPWQWGSLLLLSFIWGSSFILMKKGLQSYSPQQVAGFRVFLSYLFIMPISIRYLNTINRHNLFSLFIVGFVGIAIPAFLFTTAQTRIDSSLAGVLNSLTPLSTLIIGLILYHSKTRWINVLGIFIGLVGALALIMERSGTVFRGFNAYGLLVALATLCYGININEVKARLGQMGGIQITALALFLVGPVAGLFLLFSDFSSVPSDPHALKNFLFVGILALFGSVVAIIIFNNLIRYTTALFASSVTYIIPLFAIMWGVFDGEQLQLIQMVWIALILFGVYLVNR